MEFLSQDIWVRLRIPSPVCSSIERRRDGDRAERLRQWFVRSSCIVADRSVIDDLPPCTTTIEHATLTPEQATLYGKPSQE